LSTRLPNSRFSIPRNCLCHISPPGYALIQVTIPHKTSVLSLSGFMNMRARPLVNGTLEFLICEIPMDSSFWDSPEILDCSYMSSLRWMVLVVSQFRDLRPPVTQILYQFESSVSEISMDSRSSATCPPWMDDSDLFRDFHCEVSQPLVIRTSGILKSEISIPTPLLGLSPLFMRA
jgi:hypothetical protein